MKRAAYFAAALSLALLLGGCGASSNGLLSDFTATDIDGNDVDASIFEDHDLTMVNVWGTFCPACLPEMTDLAALNREYADQGFQVIGIVGDIRYTDGDHKENKIQTARDLIAQTGADYLHLLPSESLETAILNDMQGFPTTYFVDSEGNQVGKPYLLARDKDVWAGIIDALLKDVDK